MKGILEFDLPDDNCDHILAVNAKAFAIVVWDIDQYLRGKLKYGNDFKTVDEALEKTREWLSDLLYDNNISLDMIE
jgi:hypothetical protein